MAQQDIILYEVKDRVAYITLNRPERLNAINLEFPMKLRELVEKANLDDSVHVILLSGNGKAFCAGYDLIHSTEAKGLYSGTQEGIWDPLKDYQMMSYNTECFMSLWKSLKPVICKIHGFCVAGGSDLALCSDIIVAEENCKIGYPPSRIWGCPTTAMWTFRLGAEKAKRMLLTGDLISAKEAKDLGLLTYVVPFSQLDSTTSHLLKRISEIPKNQLQMQKLVINKTYENMGLNTSQTLAVLMDGIARNSEEGVYFKKRMEEVGFKQAVKERDTGDPLIAMKKSKL